MLTNTKLVLAAALLFATTTTVLANDIDESASGAQTEREWQNYLNSMRTGHGNTAFGYYVSPNQDDSSAPRKQSHSR